MADKAISELVSAEQITATDMFVLEQGGTAKKLTGQVLLNWLTAAADGHGGIQSIVKLSTSGLEDTYRITLADTTTCDFVVTNGKGISEIKKTKTSGLVDTYTITYTDGTKSTYTVTNGAKGDTGDNSYVWIKYASQEPTASSHSFGDVPDNWMGVYWGTLSAAPTDWTKYKWFKIKGEKGDTGTAAKLTASEIVYQVSTNGTTVPSGTWSKSVPAVAQGSYLWTRVTQTFNSGSPVVFYSVSRMGMDGLGSVVSVAGVSPNADGNVPLTADKVGALPIAGGTMTGPINMNGKALTGLSVPTQDDESVTKGYADQIGNAAEKKKLLFLNKTVSASAFSSDATYTDYPYRAAVALTGVTSAVIPEIIFALADAVSGNFAPVAAAYNGGVYIYASERPAAAITIPTIICWKES